jgi:hypothetical protein
MAICRPNDTSCHKGSSDACEEGLISLAVAEEVHLCIRVTSLHLSTRKDHAAVELFNDRGTELPVAFGGRQEG